MSTITNVSSNIWRAFQEQDGNALKEYVHPKALFVHMGVTFTKDEEIKVIESKGIVYKEIEFQQQTVQVFEQVTVLLNKLVLTAIVGGNEVTNPFVVTEVYSNDNSQLLSLSYTRINY